MQKEALAHILGSMDIFPKVFSHSLLRECN